jgi:hypothetical protein
MGLFGPSLKEREEYAREKADEAVRKVEEAEARHKYNMEEAEREEREEEEERLADVKVREACMKDIMKDKDFCAGTLNDISHAGVDVKKRLGELTKLAQRLIVEAANEGKFQISMDMDNELSGIIDDDYSTDDDSERTEYARLLANILESFDFDVVISYHETLDVSWLNRFHTIQDEDELTKSPISFTRPYGLSRSGASVSADDYLMGASWSLGFGSML